MDICFGIGCNLDYGIDFNLDYSSGTAHACLRARRSKRIFPGNLRRKHFWISPRQEC